MILEQIEVTSMAVFCYLVADRDGGAGLLIDPAGDIDRIFTVVDRHRVAIRYVVNTHGHFDHTSGNRESMERTGARLLIHRADAGMLKQVSSRLMSRLMGGAGSPEAVQCIGHGETITVGSLSLEVIHTPGHTPGCICIRAGKNLFTGDTLFTEGMGRTDLPGGSYPQIMDSIRNWILSLPDDTVIWPGHNYGRNPRSTVREQKRIYRGG